ncbi:hypothetical protein E4656_12625 [Natronospirillum operosum]|uniref:Uncharacterized protein n=1 Tax=Natronospirillum operosum TaxID=2759953 RepID=A0A4Z0WF86_9GAMM|nr:hypothetical protein [Natronospirillum operosum]TGG92958.1 hypothetical protein E4656_12625 [Natronospirillum operosum]
MKATTHTLNMKTARASALAILLALGAGGMLTGCDDGPAEDAGEAIDDTFDDAEDSIDDTFD